MWYILVNVSLLRHNLEFSYPYQVQGRLFVNQKATVSIYNRIYIFLHEYLNL